MHAKATAEAQQYLLNPENKSVLFLGVEAVPEKDRLEFTLTLPDISVGSGMWQEKECEVIGSGKL